MNEACSRCHQRRSKCSRSDCPGKYVDNTPAQPSLFSNTPTYPPSIQNIPRDLGPECFGGSDYPTDSGSSGGSDGGSCSGE